MVALAAGKTYLTAGDYVVEIIGGDDGFVSSERTAPGVTYGANGKTCLEINKDPEYKDGWYYNPDGTVHALSHEWTEKLRIVEELPFPIPKLPEGYAWADGFPQFREIKDGEYYVSNSYHENPLNKRFLIHEKRICSPANETKFGEKRFAVVRATVMPTTEPAKILDPLVEKYGEPEAGWRWLADEEKIEKGDECTSPYDKKFTESGNWTTSHKSQTEACKPYRRKIETETATTPKKQEVVMEKEKDYPLYYRHRDDGFANSVKYLVRTGDYERDEVIYKNGKSGKSERGWYIWDSSCDSYVKNGLWIEVPESEVTDFVASAIKLKKEEEKKIAAAKLNFPLYYNHRYGFDGDTKYVKRINENEYTVILRKDGKEPPNEILTWDKLRDQIVAEGTWVEVPEAEVNRFVASFKKPEESKPLNFPVYYKNKKGFSSDTKYVKRTSKYYYTINNKGIISSFHPWTNITDSIVNKEDPNWIEVPESEVLDFIASVTVTEANSTLVKKEEEIEMKKETAIAAGKTVAKFAGTWGFRAANYWLFEPAVNIARPIMRGVRYITLVGALCAAGYGYNHPEMVKNAIKSCIPKITIEAPEVLKG